MLDIEWFEDNNIMKGYKWSIQNKYGIVSISDEELFNRIEFQHCKDQSEKIVYAVHLGWRFNVDNQLWYRIKGN